MTKPKQGRTALVTGAGRGIGKGIALRLAADGATVAVNYSRSETAALATVEEIRAAGGDGFAIGGDVSDLQQVARLMAELGERMPALDILVNNAGIGMKMLGLTDTSVEDYDRLFAVNTRGLFFMTKHAVAMMRDGGRIVNISSTAVMARVPGLSVYAATKAAVDAFTRVWAGELASRGITVNSVQPGMVDTDLISDNMPAGALARATTYHPQGRVGQPDDLADVVAFLCGHDARWITGETIVVNGGM